MIRINRNPGAKVIVRQITTEISPENGWVKLKKVSGIIVENKGYEQYWHTCSGGRTYVNKHIIKNDCYKTYAIKLDNNVVDIEGNNIVVVREFDLTFLDRIKIPLKPITEKQYLNAKKIIKRYEEQLN